MAKEKTQEVPVVWIQAGTCTGCSVTVLNSVSPTIKNVLIDEVVPGKHVNLIFQATVMAGQGDAVIEVLEDAPKKHKGGYVLVVEGSVPTKDNGIYGTLGEHDGKAVPMADRVEALAKDALAIIALGTCAAFGGIAAGKPNPGGYVGADAFLKSRKVNKPLINIPGCPPHPDWFVATVAQVLLLGLPKPEELDELKRPKLFYGQLIHENCPRRAYFEEGKFARKFGDPGCLNELGCKGPVTYADCPLRLWNHGVNWCIGAGSPCIGCCEPGFPDLMAPMYQKLVDTNLPAIGKSAGKGAA
ncbi:MAG: hydrogenase small subunit [Chloroflexi bacterium]|nr:hydrogenase small subunit [Chloroflexota bacterium]MBM4454596.1 hydrogenase small subunit [Chloroflexota bacterium]